MMFFNLFWTNILKYYIIKEIQEKECIQLSIVHVLFTVSTLFLTVRIYDVVQQMFGLFNMTLNDHLCLFLYLCVYIFACMLSPIYSGLTQRNVLSTKRIEQFYESYLTKCI